MIKHLILKRICFLFLISWQYFLIKISVMTEPNSYNYKCPIGTLEKNTKLIMVF
jgi:hypothetical protein